jgi:hypothetical protein
MATSITHSLTTSWKNGNNQLSGIASKTADGEANRSITMTASQADLEVEMAFATADLVSIFILATQDTTLETNSTSAPDDTFALKAGRPFAWQKDTGIPNPFTAAVTAFYLTNGAAAANDIEIRVQKDATP